MAKILLVEDDQDLAALVRQVLAVDRHTIESVDNGKDAVEMLRLHPYDLVILDWMLPGVAGPDVIKQYRDRGGSAPILMLTAKSAPEEKEIGLDTGADDYVTKPFNHKEFAARVRALLRRPQAVASHSLQVGDISLDPKNCRVSKNGTDIHLLPKEFSLLELFMRYPNQVFSAEALLERVWDSESSASMDTVRTYIKTLRKKIDDKDKASAIRTVHGIGYCMDSK